MPNKCKRPIVHSRSHRRPMTRCVQRITKLHRGRQAEDHQEEPICLTCRRSTGLKTIWIVHLTVVNLLWITIFDMERNQCNLKVSARTISTSLRTKTVQTISTQLQMQIMSLLSWAHLTHNIWMKQLQEEVKMMKKTKMMMAMMLMMQWGRITN